MDFINIVLFALVSVIVLLSMKNQPRLLDEENRYHNVFLCVLLLIGVAVRVYQFGSVPLGFNQDGAMAAVDAKALADYGTDRFGMFMPTHLTAWDYSQMSSLLSYLMAPLIKLWGLSEWTARLPQLLVSILSLWVVYKLSLKLFSKNTALVILAVAAVNPWHIMQSRWALEANLLPHFFLFGFYFLVLGFEKKIYLYLSMVFFGLAMYAYGISIYIVSPFLLLISVYLLVKKQIAVRQTLLCLLIYLTVGGPFVLTMAVNFLGLETIKTPFFTIPFFENSVRSNDILFFSEHIYSQFAENFFATAKAVVFQTPDLPWNTIPQYGTMYLFSLPFTITGFYFLFKRRKERNIFALLLFLAIALASGLITANVNVNRINIVFYPLIFLCGFGIVQTASRLKASYLAIGGAFIIGFTSFTLSYFGYYKNELANYFYYGFGQCVDKVKNEKFDQIYISLQNQTADPAQVAEILTLFYFKEDAKYFTGQKQISGRLPYRERYHYVNIGETDVNHIENAVFIVNAGDEKYFDGSFKVFSYGNYRAIIKANG